MPSSKILELVDEDEYNPGVIDGRIKALYVSGGVFMPPPLDYPSVPWSYFPMALRTLSFSRSQLDIDALDLMNSLIHLREVFIVDSTIIGDTLRVCHDGIITFHLTNANGLESLKLELPGAKMIRIRNLPDLKNVNLQSLDCVRCLHISDVPRLEAQTCTISRNLSSIVELKVSSLKVMFLVLPSLGPSLRPTLKRLDVSGMTDTIELLAGTNKIDGYHRPSWDGRTTDLVRWFREVGDRVIPPSFREKLALVRYLNLTNTDVTETDVTETDVTRLALCVFANAVPNLQELVMHMNRPFDKDDMVLQVLGTLCQKLLVIDDMKRIEPWTAAPLHDNTMDVVCAICHEHVQKGKKNFPCRRCNHMFHSDCILELVQHGMKENDPMVPRCPTCRVPILLEALESCPVEPTLVCRWVHNYNSDNGLLRLYRDDPELNVRFLNQVLSVYIEVHGDENTDVAGMYNHIGCIYHAQGKYEDALEVWRKTLEITVKVHGPEHLSVAITENNIGLIHCDNGFYKEALIMFNKVLKTREKLLGAEHQSVADTQYFMGMVLMCQEKYVQAFEFISGALKIREKLLGPEHLDVAKLYNNIGTIHCNLCKYDEALAAYHKSLDIKIKVYGPEHPDVAKTKELIARVQIFMNEGVEK